MDTVLAIELANQEMLIRSRDRRRNRTTEDQAYDAEDRAFYAERDKQQLTELLLEAKTECAGSMGALRCLLAHDESLKRSLLALHEETGALGGVPVVERQRLAMEAVEAYARKLLDNPKNQTIIDAEVRDLVDRYRPLPRRK